MMKEFTTSTASIQAADVSICFKAIKAFQSNTIAQRLLSKNVGKGFTENGLIEDFEEPSSLTCCKYLFLLMYQWSCMRSLSFCLIRNNDGCEK